MRVQLAWTMLAEIAVMISGILLLKLAAQFLDPAGFGEYTLSRRAVGLLYLPLVMGLGIAAPRYIAIAMAGALPEHSASSFAFAALICGMLPPLVVAALMNIDQNAASAVLFGDTSLVELVRPASIALVGIALHSMVYAVYRGRGEMAFANVMQVVSLGLIPVAVFLLSERDAAALLGATGVAWIVASAVSLLFLIGRLLKTGERFAHPRKHAGVLLRFGLPRLPGEFALVGLFAIPALLALRAQGVVAAGQFSAALSLVTIFSGAFTPVGLLVLPRASALAAQGNIAGVRRIAGRVLLVGTVVAVCGVIVGQVVLAPLIQWYFGAAFLPAVPVFRICLIAAIPYIVYVLLRNVLDALDVRAINSRNLLMALTMLAILCLVRSTIMWMALSLVVSLSFLSILTLRDTYNRLKT